MKHNKKLLALLGSIILLEAFATGLLPTARGYLFSLLTAKAGPIVLALLYYFLNYLSIDFFQSIKGYVVLKTSLWYRTLRTHSVNVDLWNGLAKETVKREEPRELPSNTPQRIQEDIKLSYLQRISVWTEYAISGLILIQLIILNLSEPLLILFALTYAGISILIAARFNPRLTRAEIDVQQAEASYRTGLVTSVLDISGLSIANKASLTSKWIQTEYLLFTKLQLGLIAVLPYALLLPKLLDGSIDLGILVQHAASFGLLVVNASILLQLYPILIQGRASEIRAKQIVSKDSS